MRDAVNLKLLQILEVLKNCRLNSQKAELKIDYKTAIIAKTPYSKPSCLLLCAAYKLTIIVFFRTRKTHTEV